MSIDEQAFEDEWEEEVEAQPPGRPVAWISKQVSSSRKIRRLQKRGTR